MSKTVEDLARIYDDAYENRARLEFPTPEMKRAMHRAGIAAVVRALRDEIENIGFQEEMPFDPALDFLDEILGDAGDHRQASGSGPASVHTLEQRPDPQAGESANTVDAQQCQTTTTSPADPMPSVCEWRTIESAPKDGTEIIGCYYEDHGDGIVTYYGPWTIAWCANPAYWRSSWDGRRVVEYMGDFGTDYMDPDCPPTHWMPLPTPPEVK